MKESKKQRSPRYAARQLLPPWMLRRAADAKSIVVASPYITDELFFRRYGLKCDRVFTEFSALNFISGASSLRLLKRLIQRGVSIFHIKGLHAKVVMIDSACFSLGSQNLTVKGRLKNVEANFVAGDESPVHEVLEFFERLMSMGRAITLDDIEVMNALVISHQREFKRLASISSEIDEQVESEGQKRVEAERLLREAEDRRRTEQEQAERHRLEYSQRQRRENNERIRAALEDAKIQGSRGIVATVQERQSKESLKPVDRNQSFAVLLAAAGVKPKRLFRYLIVNTDNGQLGFVRFAETQWTFFQPGISYSEEFSFDSFRWAVEVIFEWGKESDKHRSGVVHLRRFGTKAAAKNRVASADFMFSLKGVQMESIIVNSSAAKLLLPTATRISELTSQDFKNALVTYLLDRLSKPFKFTKKLVGKSAGEFFDAKHPAKFLIQVHKLGGAVLFSAGRVRM